VKKLEGKPFALIGVSATSPRELRQVMDKEKLNWRSFADGGRKDGTYPIWTKWNVPHPTTLYVLDHKGVIRHKWVDCAGEKAIDKALGKLVKEAEPEARK
jgi:peroxiredoxin